MRLRHSAEVFRCSPHPIGICFPSSTVPLCAAVCSQLWARTCGMKREEMKEGQMDNTDGNTLVKKQSKHNCTSVLRYPFGLNLGMFCASTRLRHRLWTFFSLRGIHSPLLHQESCSPSLSYSCPPWPLESCQPSRCLEAFPFSPNHLRFCPSFHFPLYFFLSPSRI